MTGTSLPRFIVIFAPSVPRSCGLATILVLVSDSRNRTIAVGTARYQSAAEMPREMVFKLNIGGGTTALGEVDDRPVFAFPVLFPGVPVEGTTVRFGDCSGEKTTPTAYS